MPSRIVPLILAVALFMENMDATVISTSLAEIARDIGTEPVALKLALTAYLVALAIFIPVSSWMADRFGARNVFRWAIVVFMVGSVCCAISNSLATFVLSRFLQGMGGALMTPIARLVLVRATPRNQLVDAMAWLSIPGLVGPILGPPIGGAITTYLSWHWIFIINVPIGIAGIILVTIFLPDWHRNAPRKMDFPGFFLAGTAFAGWVFGISVVTLPALPIEVGAVTLAVGTLAALGYYLHYRRAEYPLLDLGLFRLPIFSATMLGGTFFRLGTGAVPFLFPLMLQLVFGLNPFQSGMVTFASAIGSFTAKFLTDRALRLLGFRTGLMLTGTCTVLGVLCMGFYTPATPVWLIMSLLVLMGFAQSVFWTTTNAFVFADVEDKDAGQANVLSQVGIQLSLAFGVALGGGALELFRLGHGGAETLPDFHWAFYVMAAVGIIAVFVFARLPRSVGMGGPAAAAAGGGH